MKSASYIAAYIVKKLWTTAAVMLVFVAVVMSLLRYSLPYMDGQKDRLQNWLSQQYGVELAIGELSAGWSGIGPTLLLRDISLQQSERSPISLDIKETQVELDFWGSVYARKVHSRQFELNGLTLTIDIDQLEGGGSDYPIVEALQSLFLEQLQDFAINDSRIGIFTKDDAQLIDIQRLRWINSDDRHQGVGELRVVELASNSAYFGLELYGAKDALNGTFYAKGEDLDLAPLLNQLTGEHLTLKKSRGNFALWAGINNSAIADVQVELGDSQFDFKTQEDSVSAAVKGGMLTAIPHSGGWRFAVDNLALQIEDESLISSWYGDISQSGALHISNQSPVPVSAMLPAAALIADPDTVKTIQSLAPTAKISHLAMLMDDTVSLTMRFEDFSWQQHADIPGLAGLQGELNWFDGHGHLAFSAGEQTLRISNVLDDDLPFQSLSGEVSVSAQEQDWDIFLEALQFKSDVVSLTAQARYRTADNNLAILSNVSPLAVQRVKALFPDLMGQDTKRYLNRALQAGQIQSAKLIWQGSPSSFPFNDNDGVFQAAVEIQHADFSFDADWPSLTQLDIDLLFENETLFMRSEAGTIAGVNLEDLHAVIPSLTAAAVLSIDAKGFGQGDAVAALMRDSELADSVGEALTTGVQVNGLLNTDLNLHIPLSGDDVIASGTVYLSNNEVMVPSLDMKFSDANGTVTFVNDKVTAESLQANLLEQAVNIQFKGQQSASAYLADIDVEGQWQVAPLLSEFQAGLAQHVDGEVPWLAKVSLVLPEEGYDYTFSLASQLEGVTSDLPAPFAKTADSVLPFAIRGKGNQQASNIVATLGREVKFTGVLPHNEMQFSRAHLSIGEEEFVSMGLGFSVSVSLDEADFSSWYGAVSALVDKMPGTDKPILSEPDRIYVDVRKLTAFGTELNKLELVAKHQTDNWLLEFNSRQARATVTLFDDWDNEGVQIDADFVRLDELPDNAYQDGEAQQEIALLLPPIRFNCGDCQILNKPLGNVNLSLKPTKHGMNIASLRLLNDHGLLQATGAWTINEGVATTSLSGDLNSDDFGALLKGFDVESGIKDSEADVSFDLRWNDDPYNLALASLNGDITWRLSDGYLTEVSDKGSRLFSVLSLQSLVRKLSLDFRDVFAKGFFYDKMGGSFQIENGKAYTQDTVIDGGAGEMTIAGFTDLDNRALNYQISFTPNVTSSLPLLVYWMVNPATAIAALAIDQVLTEAKVISNIRYSVTGTLDEPVFSELDRKSKDISLPAQTTPPEALPPTDDQNGQFEGVEQLEPLTLEVENG
ncbi:YhdP family protein [Aestuariibacter sp. AA17]|uniref:YhdP family protein n=1 Tax=Fluctibacter corallii TaxID=2984329 RepID=A0ABT3AB07_9ALTE|nr:YhdP family protein [Aestuariibacter sp. AA17]MCV2885770.1 YhdP family protein [Aestuariibacter sp. AA17]